MRTSKKFSITEIIDGLLFIFSDYGTDSISCSMFLFGSYNNIFHGVTVLEWLCFEFLLELWESIYWGLSLYFLSDRLSI